MTVIRISEAEAERDILGLMARARAGAEIVIGTDSSIPLVLHTVTERPLRKLSDSLRLAKEHGSTATLDGHFASDLEAVVNSHREPLSPPQWD